jgi:protein-disulfide isomerase
MSRTHFLVFAVFGFLALIPAYLFAETMQTPIYSNNPVVAILDGKPMRMNDLISPQMHDAMDRLHQMQEAALKKKSLEILSRKHPELNKIKARPVTPQDIVHFYKTTPGVEDFGTFEQMRDEIKRYLTKTFRENFVETQYQMALEKGWLKVFLEPPGEFVLVAKVDSAMKWFEDKNKSRKVLLLEYSDFQCPFCKRVQGTLVKLRRRYSKEVQFGYRHFPLSFHKEAKQMAEAVECARDQGKFWQLHSLFYKTPESIPITSALVMELARRARVKNMQAFQKCWIGGKHEMRVLADIQEGASMGIQGTPAFIVGIYDHDLGSVSGEILSGAISEESFMLVIEKYIALTRTTKNMAQHP